MIAIKMNASAAARHVRYGRLYAYISINLKDSRFFNFDFILFSL